jgi:hypothetical protein
MECHLINATAPFIINSELKELLCRLPETDKYIVNVRCAFSDRNLPIEEVIGSHACSREASMHATNGIPLGCSLLLSVGTVNYIETLKVSAMEGQFYRSNKGSNHPCGALSPSATNLPSNRATSTIQTRG